MSKFQTTTRGGHDYRITGRDPEFASLIRGEVDDSGVTIHVQWTEGGRCNLDSESQYDLIPVEPEASPAKARVDLALAAHCLLTAVVEFQRAEDAVEQHKKLLLNAFVASGKTEVVVKIDGEHYLFWTENAKVRFRKIEVL